MNKLTPLILIISLIISASCKKERPNYSSTHDKQLNFNKSDRDSLRPIVDLQAFEGRLIFRNLDIYQKTLDFIVENIDNERLLSSWESNFSDNFISMHSYYEGSENSPIDSDVFSRLVSPDGFIQIGNLVIKIDAPNEKAYVLQEEFYNHIDMVPNANANQNALNNTNAHNNTNSNANPNANANALPDREIEDHEHTLEFSTNQNLTDYLEPDEPVECIACTPPTVVCCIIVDNGGGGGPPQGDGCVRNKNNFVQMWYDYDDEKVFKLKNVYRSLFVYFELKTVMVMKETVTGLEFFTCVREGSFYSPRNQPGDSISPECKEEGGIFTQNRRKIVHYFSGIRCLDNFKVDAVFTVIDHNTGGQTLEKMHVLEAQ